MDRVERARELFEHGNHRAALQLLKTSARREGPPFEVRRALAELYRELGCPDQAARWGIVLDGWTTELERDRLARSIVARRVDRRSIRAFLALPPDTAHPSDLRAVLEDSVPKYGAKLHARAAVPVERTTTASERAREIAAAFGGAALIGSSVALVVVYGIVLLGGDGARFWAAAVGTLILILSGVGLTALGWAHVLESRRPRGIVYVAGGVGLVAVSVAAQSALGAS